MKNQRSGFALVIALSLMAFVLLLLLSITTLVTVETSNAETHKQQLLARENAKLAAMIALGDLQKWAGSDQRVTARADILQPSDGTVYRGLEQWTGVWSSKQDVNDAVDFAFGLNEHKPQWLVSGDLQTYVDADNRINSALPAAQSVKLASLGRSVDLANEEVHVLKVPIKGEADVVDGEYAFWVSDDGVKARLNLSRADPADLALGQQMLIAQQPDATAVRATNQTRPYSVNDESLWKQSLDAPSRLFSVSQLPLVAGSAGVDSEQLQREFFHDFTVHSNSLFTDTRSGGLKRDLSSALRNLPSDLLNATIFPNTKNSYSALHTDVGVGPDSPDALHPSGDPGGPKWTQLSDYYKQTFSNSDLSVNASIDVRPHSNDQIAITPIVTRYNLIVQAVATFVGDDPNIATDYEYRLGLFPLITLWNPYDRPLKFDELGLYIHLPDLKLTHDAHTHAEGNPIISMGDIFKLGNENKSADSIDNYKNKTWKSIGFKLAGMTIPAGRAVNFSPEVNGELSYSNPGENMLSAGATDAFVYGYFTPPLTVSDTITSDPLNMFHENGYCRMRIYAKNHSRNFMALSTNGSVNERSGRFLSMILPGTNFNNLQPRVLPMSAEGQNEGAKVIEGVLTLGSEDTPFDLVEMQAATHGSSPGGPGTMAGAASILSLPRSDIGGANALRKSQRIHFLGQMNPRSPLVLPHTHINETYPYRMYDHGAEADSSTTRYLNFTTGADDVWSYVGLSNSFDTEGRDRMVLYEAPTRVPLSIGNLMHANLNHVYRLAPELSPLGFRSNKQPLHVSPSYAIGNSLASIHLPLGFTKLNIREDMNVLFSSTPNIKSSTENGAFYDYSYELNDELWDRFFFSSIAPNGTSANSSALPVQFPLPNARVKKWSDVANDSSELVDERSVASHLVLEGGFNINSTSVAAWESILGALRDVEPVRSTFADSDATHNFARMAAPYYDSTNDVPDYDSDLDSIIAGFRSLTDDQITALAEELVEEVRQRRSSFGYPFLSLSDFVNRTPIDPNNVPQGLLLRYAYCGALQYAIDQSGLNGDLATNGSGGTGLSQSGYVTPPLPTTVELFHRESLEAIKDRPLVEGAVGSLTQADVLSKIGALITPRSDTFTIRTYGSAFGLGEHEVQAYYEIVVQRTPDYVDSTLNSDELPAANTTNGRFGRRFEILSARWVPEDEV